MKKKENISSIIPIFYHFIFINIIIILITRKIQSKNNLKIDYRSGSFVPLVSVNSEGSTLSTLLCAFGAFEYIQVERMIRNIPPIVGKFKGTPKNMLEQRATVHSSIPVAKFFRIESRYFKKTDAAIPTTKIN